MFEIREILDLAIQIEENGEALYRRAAADADNAETSALLTWLADEESRHAEFFKEFRDALTLEETHPVLAELKREVFADILDRRTFSLEEKDVAALETAAQVVEASVEFESDTALFYEVLAPFVVDEGTAAQLRRIIQEERRHFEKLTALLPTMRQPAV
jgi:rubrerythrin